MTRKAWRRRRSLDLEGGCRDGARDVSWCCCCCCSSSTCPSRPPPSRLVLRVLSMVYCCCSVVCCCGVLLVLRTDMLRVWVGRVAGGEFPPPRQILPESLTPAILSSCTVTVKTYLPMWTFCHVNNFPKPAGKADGGCTCSCRLYELQHKRIGSHFRRQELVAA